MSEILVCEKAEWPFLVAFNMNNKRIWGLELDFNLVWEFDIRERDMCYIGQGPNSESLIKHAYHSAIRYQDKFFCFPYRETYMAIYDTKKKVWEKVDLGLQKELEADEKMKQNEVSHQLPGRFYGGCVYQNQVFLFPFGYRGLVKYDIKTRHTSHCIDFKDTVLKDDAALFHNYVQIDEERIALSCFYSNHVVILNLKENKMDIRTVGKEGYRFTSIVKYKNEYWLVVKNKLIFIKWDLDTNSEKEFTKFPDDCEIINEKHCFDDCNIYEKNGFLYCFPASCNMAVKINLKDGKIEEIGSLKEYCQDTRLDRQRSIFNGGIRVENKVYLQYQLGGLIEFDLEIEKVLGYHKIIRNEASLKKRMEDALAFFCKIIPKKGNDKIEQNRKKVGVEIYDTISKCIL